MENVIVYFQVTLNNYPKCSMDVHQANSPQTFKSTADGVSVIISMVIETVVVWDAKTDRLSLVVTTVAAVSGEKQNQTAPMEQ